MQAWLGVAGRVTELRQVADAAEAMGWEPPARLVAFDALHLVPGNIAPFLLYRDCVNTDGHVALIELEAWCRLAGQHPTWEIIRRVRLIERLVLEHRRRRGTQPQARMPAHGHPGPNRRFR